MPPAFLRAPCGWIVRFVLLHLSTGLQQQAGRSAVGLPLEPSSNESSSSAGAHLIFHSQKGQDRWVYETLLGEEGTGGSGSDGGGTRADVADRISGGGFGSRPGGYYVDLAANEPIFESNTFFFDRELGWQGVCIDGNSKYLDLYNKTRTCLPVLAVVDCAAGKSVGWVNRAALSGIVGGDVDNKVLMALWSRPERRATRTLAEILAAAGAPPIIDYLSLDIEGSEWRALKNFPFEEYRFRAVTIERPPPWLNELLARKGYVWVKNSGHDSYYVHSTELRALRTASRRRDGHYEQLLAKCAGIPGTDCPWPEAAPELDC